MRAWVGRWRRSPTANWRAVPVVNLLEDEGRRRKGMVRAFLVLSLLVGAYLLLNLYQEGNTLKRETDEASSRLRISQAALASRRDEVNSLEGELWELQNRLRAQQNLPQQPGSERWQMALAALEKLQVDGVQFESLQGKAVDELTVVAVAAVEQPLAQLQNRLHETAQPFELRDVHWGRDKESITLTAILRVRASP
ncbi:MAG: hypothetical protein HY672_00370 [Chloroflexi bacterium]|nr:hypothetical protein [Chloroflexota bacterium]